MKKVLFLLFAGLLSAQICYAGGNSKITLNDGTTIYGKVVGMSDGVYTIKTDTMGDIKVNSDNVVEISSGSKASNSNQSSIGIIDGSNRRSSNYSSDRAQSNNSSNSYSSKQQDVNAMVQSRMMDENFMENLMQLGSSPEMQSVLDDPEVMEAIQNGDYDFLMNNSKMNDLMNSSEIQGILGGMN
ncbi:MAG: hypothetical protein II961_05565 [Candidatus Riflebacteria bacterium]|nr:hypothetical protein [Candidatus Riflebacteria bacterium]